MQSRPAIPGLRPGSCRGRQIFTLFTRRAAPLLWALCLVVAVAAAAGCREKAPPPARLERSPLDEIFPADDRVIDLSHPETRNFGFGDQTNEVKRWQGFVATQNARLTAVEVRIRARSGPPVSPLTVELFAMKDGLPTGTALAANAITLPGLTTRCVVVRCPLEYDKLKRGESYAIVLGQETPHVWCYMWETAKYERDVPGYEKPLKPTSDFPFGKWDGAIWKPELGCGIGWLKVYLE